jgi:DNA gyrase subunit A
MDNIADLLDILAPRAHHRDHRGRADPHQAAVWRPAALRVVMNTADINIEDLIAPQDMVVTLSHTGYFKRQPLTDYRAQKRGGRGKQAAAVKDDDFVDQLFVANTHDHILCFSNRGRLYWLKVYEVPEGTRNSRGKPIVNLFPLLEGEKITAVLPVKEFDEGHFVFMATAQGTVKKTPLTDFSNPRKAASSPWGWTKAITWWVWPLPMVSTT